MFRIFKRIFAVVIKYKYTYFLAIFCVAVSSILMNLTPILIKQIVDQISTKNTELGYNFFALLLISSFFRIIIRSIGLEFSDMVVLKSAKDLRLKVFSHIHNLDFAYHTNKSSGSLISLFKRGESAFLSFYDHISIWSLETIVGFIFMIVIFLSLYPKLILVSIVTFLLNIIFMFFTIKLNVSKRKIANSWEDKITGVTVDNMVAFDTVKYFANEDYEQEKLDNLTNNWKDAFIEYGRSFRIIDLGNGGMVTAGMLLVIGIAMYDLSIGQISTGNFVLATSFATLFFPKLLHLVFNMREIAKNYADLMKYLYVLDETVQIKDNFDEIAIRKWKELERTQKYSIVFEDVDFSFDQKKDVLSDINLKIKPFESIAIAGRSGAGKTTLTRLLMRFFDPQKGKILIGGVNIRYLPKKIFRKKIGFVPQDPILFNDTIGYNIAYGRKNFELGELIKSTKIANLYSFIQSLPEGFQTVVGERGIKLSGGQKQRLAIARVVMEGAPIIIFDEATSNLDSESEKLIQEAFWEIAKKRTTIIIAHRLSTLKKASRIIVLDDGKVVEEGTHHELTNKKSGIYKYLWKLQTAGELKE